MLFVLGPVAAQIGIRVLSANSGFVHLEDNANEEGVLGLTAIQSGFLVHSVVNLHLCMLFRVCGEKQRSRRRGARPNGHPKWALNPLRRCLPLAPWPRRFGSASSPRIPILRGGLSQTAWPRRLGSASSLRI